MKKAAAKTCDSHLLFDETDRSRSTNDAHDATGARVHDMDEAVLVHISELRSEMVTHDHRLRERVRVEIGIIRSEIIADAIIVSIWKNVKSRSAHKKKGPPNCSDPLFSISTLLSGYRCLSPLLPRQSSDRRHKDSRWCRRTFRSYRGGNRSPPAAECR